MIYFFVIILVIGSEFISFSLLAIFHHDYRLCKPLCIVAFKQAKNIKDAT